MATKTGKYKVSFEVIFKIDKDGKRDIGDAFIGGVLSDVKDTHGLSCKKVKIIEQLNSEPSSSHG